ncbi:MAG: crossover junction endodeoxyribonuclease RuvC, partial [Bacteroidota bacterium]
MPSSTSAVYRILGIDPGTTVLGYAVIEIHPKSRRVLELGTLKLDKFKDHPRRLQLIHER